MLTPKCWHTLCNANDIIFCVGGYNGSIEVSDCEKYSIIRNSWKSLPDLLTHRYWCGAFAFNVTQIYCLGGCSNSYLNSSEKLNVERSKWENVNLLNMFSDKSCLHGIQINDNDVLVFGGGNDASEGYGVECFILKIGTPIECIRESDMTISSSFCCCAAPTFDGKCIYGNDKDKKIHKFSIATKQWKMIKI